MAKLSPNVKKGLKIAKQLEKLPSKEQQQRAYKQDIGLMEKLQKLLSKQWFMNKKKKKSRRK
jgi:hypothetical protein